MKRVHIIVRGRVQGVFFRATTQEAANRAGVRGWVQNSADGAVEIVAEGDEAQIAEFTSWCRKGPPLAEITDIDFKEEPATGDYTSFRIKYF